MGGQRPAHAARAEPAATEGITFLSLLNELTDRDQLALHPAGNVPYTLLQASSYDRNSVAPEDTPGWFANDDWSWYLRSEQNQGRTEWVLLDAEGPGVVTRFWLVSTRKQKGTLRFYLDGDSVPFWAGRAGERIGRNASIGRPLSARSVELEVLEKEYAKPGNDLYLPIPYSKGLKITYDLPPDHNKAHTKLYYNINYRRYVSGTHVKSFDPKSLADPTVAARLSSTSAQLLDPDRAPRGSASRALRVSGTLGSGRHLEQVLSGPAAIRRLRLRLQAADQTSALEQTELELWFDGKQTARIPVGHFFGTGSERLQKVHEWYRTVDPTTGRMTVYWTMPYRQTATVRVVHRGSQAVQAELQLETGAWQWTPNSMHFHAAYREQAGLQTQPREGQDWNYVSIRGKGVYVGDTLQVSKPIGGWWGEGDEKIYVDGEPFPSHFGTGTEDYYGYAWGHGETFNHPFISQPQGDANRRKIGGTSVNSRTRALDAIPFHKSLKFDMEVWNWHGGPVDYSVATFWYAVPR